MMPRCVPDETGEPSGATESDDATESGMDEGSDGESKPKNARQ